MVVVVVGGGVLGVVVVVGGVVVVVVVVVGGGGGGGGGGGVPAVDVPNVSAQYTAPFGATAAPMPVARKADCSMLARWPGDESQPCMTASADG